MKIRQLARVAVLVALSVLGSFIKIPSMVGSLAFDAVPGYYAALAVSPLTGAVVAGLGHVATAFVSGLPLGAPIHAIVVLGMTLAGYVTGVAAKRSRLLGCAAGVVINGLALPALFIVIPGFGMAFFLAATPSILGASVLNVSVALALAKLPLLAKVSHAQ
jgi:riboflavin transporter FmnP